jgi:4-amino-4-deoxy-L-arabinose transferase-like glycosyltransferase
MTAPQMPSRSLPVRRTTPRFSLNSGQWSVVIVLLVAFFFRTHELAGLGLGLEHDEVAEWQIADGIRHGRHALFFPEAYGQEPLFLYLMAGSTVLIGDNVMGVRFTSVFVAMLTLAAAYRLLRRLFSPTVALVAVAGMAIALWPVFWGRVALRAMTLPLMLCLAFDFLWRGLMKDEGGRRKDEGGWHRSPFILHPSSFILHPSVFCGLFFGLSAYTYLSARALPILLAAFTVYLALCARDRMRGRWRGLCASYLVGGLIALPLIVTLFTNPALQFRVSEVSGPLDKALQGDWSEVGANVGRVVGMFTAQGDSTVRDNWPDRPVFPEPIGAALFGAGVLIALAKWRQPRYALALIWIGAMLIPTLVTTGAPNFTRALGALPLVFALPGLAVEWLLFRLPRLVPVRDFKRMSRVTGLLIGAALIGVLGINAASTYDDYFNQWPQQPETQFVFQADFAAIAKDLDASDATKVYVGGLSNDTLDNSSLYLLRRRKDVQVGWFDSGSPLSSGGALMGWFTGGPPTYIPSIVPVLPLLMTNLSNARCIETVDAARYRRYQSQCGGMSGPSPAARWFEDTAIFVGASSSVTQTWRPGEARQFTTTWRAAAPIAYPRRIFVHLIDPQTGRIVAQHDGLDSPTKYWQPDDTITQAHTLLIPAETAPGLYELWVGLYNPTNGQRVRQTDGARREPPSDHIVLGAIQVVR